MVTRADFLFLQETKRLRIRLSHLQLDRPLCVLDLETTGTDPAHDRIIEVGIVRIEPDGTATTLRQLVNPGIPIPPTATQVHGITDAVVALAPSFPAVASHLVHLLAGADLAGFGITRFDLPLLTAEFARAGIEFRITGRWVVDALRIFHQHEPRDLSAAVRFYLGRDHVQAHTATADAHAALQVLDQQIGRYGLSPTPAGLHTTMIEVDVWGLLGLSLEGQRVLRFGKHTGQPLATVAKTDPGYLRWLLGRPLLDDARGLIQQALNTSH